MSEVIPAQEAGPAYYWSFPEERVLLLGKASIKGTGHEGYLSWLKDQNRLATGKLAVASFSAAKDGEVVDLGALLRSEEPSLERIGDRHQFQDWTPEESLAYGRWLYSILPDPNPGSWARLNKAILTRANLLALGPGTKNLFRNFGSISNFYIQIGASDTTRKFTGVTADEAADYVLSLAKQNEHDLYGQIHQRSKEDPSRLPYSTLKRLLPKGPVTGFLREAGYLRSERGKGVAQLEWGVDFMLANSGTPTQTDIKVLSKLGRALHSSATYRYFGGDTEYQKTVASSFEAELEKVKESFRSQTVPLELLRSVGSVTEMIARYVRYGITSQLLPELAEENRVSLSIFKWGESDFVDHLAGHDPSITWFDVRKASNPHGVFRNVWRTEYIESLATDKAVADILDQSRGQLSSEQRQKYYDGIAEAIDFMDGRGIKALRKVWIDRLQADNKLASGAKFEHLYGSADYFRIIVNARRRQYGGILRNGQRAALLEKSD